MWIRSSSSSSVSSSFHTRLRANNLLCPSSLSAFPPSAALPALPPSSSTSKAKKENNNPPKKRCYSLAEGYRVKHALSPPSVNCSSQTSGFFLLRLRFSAGTAVSSPPISVAHISSVTPKNPANHPSPPSPSPAPAPASLSFCSSPSQCCRAMTRLGVESVHRRRGAEEGPYPGFPDR